MNRRDSRSSRVPAWEGESFQGRYLSGRALYGDDFTESELESWFEDEREGYANLGSAADEGGTGYGYHALNERHGFRYLPGGRRFRHALGVGSARAEEFSPIAGRLDAVTVLEPSSQLVGGPLPGGVVPEYVKPSADGMLPMSDGAFDLVLCFGTLHHIPNVSSVLREIGRVVSQDGWVLIREPVISMGDWRFPRKPGVTERERGIPRDLLVSMTQDAGLVVKQAHWCGFPVIPRVGHRLETPAYNSPLLVLLDDAASRLTRPLYRYHASAGWQRIRPTSAFLVCHKA